MQFLNNGEAEAQKRTLKDIEILGRKLEELEIVRAVGPSLYRYFQPYIFQQIFLAQRIAATSNCLRHLLSSLGLESDLISHNRGLFMVGT